MPGAPSVAGEAPATPTGADRPRTAPGGPILRNLLATWETWSARDTLTRALDRVSTDQARDTLTRSLADMPEVEPLDALRDTTELVVLLRAWRWQAVGAARRSGASWDEIGSATGVTAEEARAEYEATVARLIVT